VRTLTGHTSTVFDLALSPDETLLATAGDDATVRVWDLAQGRQLLILTGHTKGVNSVSFSPDGKRLISASDDGTVRVYVLPISELVDLAQERLTRTWTEEECLQFLQLAADQCPPTP
jgi:WD40 repeat protein